MGDLLIRDMPEDVLAALDKRAKTLGLSRSEYVRRRLAQEAQFSELKVTVDHWRIFADAYCDLGTAEVMDQAWR